MRQDLEDLFYNNIPKLYRNKKCSDSPLVLKPLLLQLGKLSLDLLVLMCVGRYGARQSLETHILQDVVDLSVFAAQVGHYLRLGLGGETTDKTLLAGLPKEAAELDLYVADKVIGAVLVELA